MVCRLRYSLRKWWMRLFADLLGGPAKAALDDFEMTYWGSESEEDSDSDSEKEEEDKKESEIFRPPPVPYRASIRKFMVPVIPDEK